MKTTKNRAYESGGRRFESFRARHFLETDVQIRLLAEPVLDAIQQEKAEG
jgi:hypothetical protein